MIRTGSPGIIIAPVEKDTPENTGEKRRPWTTAVYFAGF
jgi:hypothetical protein